MVITFYNREQPDAHARFQAWRRLSPGGYFLNCKTARGGLIHRVDCRHSGNYDWTVEEYGHDLTRQRKVCAPKLRELRLWAHRHDITDLSYCQDCSPSEEPEFVDQEARRATIISESNASGIPDTHQISLGAVSTKIESLLIDPSTRTTLLAIFAESLDYIERHSPGLAMTHLLPDRLRLFAGRLIVLTLEVKSVWVTLGAAESARHESALANMISWEWDKTSYPQYRRIPSRNGYYTPSDDKNDEWPSLRRLHFAYLDRVLERPAGVDPRSMAKHEPLVAAYLASVLRRGVDSRLPEEVEDAPKYSEGSLTRIVVNRFERDGRARDECLRRKGRKCVACGMSFAQRYGFEVAELIHVHHLVPLSSIREDYSPDPGADLVPVCPNCHAVIHYARGETPRTIEEVRSLLRRSGETGENGGNRIDQSGDAATAAPDRAPRG